MKHYSPTAGESDTAVCPSCLAPIDSSGPFCARCGAPVGATAALDPLNVLRSEGYMLDRALKGRPKPIVLLGVWALFLPTFVGGIYGAINAGLHMDASSGFIFFWFMSGLSIVSFVVLYRITKNYVTIPKKSWGDDG